MNPIEEYVTASKNYITEHPDVQYTRHQYFNFNEGGEVTEACLIGIGILARRPDLTPADWHTFNDHDELEHLYPGMNEWMCWTSYGGDRNITHTLNILNADRSMTAEQALDYLLENVRHEQET